MSELFMGANSMTVTENGAAAYATSGKKCLDFFAVAGALRGASETRILRLFEDAFAENPLLALKILFYTRDIRNGGLGEKRVFRIIAPHLHELIGRDHSADLYDAIIEFGSWKDLFESFPIEIIGEYVAEKMKNHISSGNYDLLEKWAPSIGGAKNKSAEYLAKLCGMSPKQYRKYLSAARSQIKIVEQKMCAGDWGNIEYDRVPSKASLTYGHAFKRHDAEGYSKYLEDVAAGKKTIHAKTLYPYEIIKNYLTSYSPTDATVEELWRALPDYTNAANENALVMADVSGSMTGLPMQVSVSLAIYFAERNTGKFHNEFMTFSANPTFVSLNDCSTLNEKAAKAKDAEWGMNTDLNKAFRKILETGKRFHLPESEMPKTLYIISDMEFDEATSPHGYRASSEFTPTAYEAIKRDYEQAGYELPAIIFWNVASHQDNLPVKMDDVGTALVSGCSPAIFKMAVSGDIDPMKMMYQAVDSFPGWAEAADKLLE